MTSKYVLALALLMSSANAETLQFNGPVTITIEPAPNGRVTITIEPKPTPNVGLSIYNEIQQTKRDNFKWITETAARKGLTPEEWCAIPNRWLCEQTEPQIQWVDRPTKVENWKLPDVQPRSGPG